MRFTVIGTDAETGQAVELTVEARDADMAERFAAKRQINVQKVSIAKAVGEASPPACDTSAAAMEPLAPLAPMPVMSIAGGATMPAPAAQSIPSTSTTSPVRPPVPTPAPQPPASRPVPSPSVPAVPAISSAPAAVARPAPAPVPAAPAPAAVSPGFSSPMVRPQHAGNSRPGRGMAIAAVVLGLISLLFCWIPVISLLSMPLSGIGLLLAIIAGVLVITKKRGSIVMPVAGVAVCGLCLFVTLMVTSSLITEVAAAADQMKSEMNRQSAQAGQEEKAATSKPARNLSVVASDPKHSATIPALSVVAPGTAASAQLPEDKTDLGKPVVIGVAELSITRIAVEPVTLVGDDGYLQGESESRFLTLKIEVKNTGKDKMVYRTLAVDSMATSGPTLRDDLGRLYPSVTFGLTARPSGRAQQETLEPGAIATDVLVFQPAAVGGKPKWLQLDIPGKLLGGDHTVTAKVSAESIR